MPELAPLLISPPLADGTNLTTTNAPPISVITTSNTPEVPPRVHSADGPLLGAQYFEAGSTTTGKTSFARITGLSGRWGALRTPFRFKTLPGAACDWMTVDNSSATAIFTMGMSSADTMQLKSPEGVAGTYGTALTAMTTYILEVQWGVGTATASPFDGALAAQLYAADGTTLLWSYSATNRNLGTAQASLIRCPGKHTGTPIYTVQWSWLKYATSTTGTVPAQGNVVRTITANAGADKTVEPWASDTLDASSSTSSTGISAATWSKVSGPDLGLSSSTAAVPTFTAPASLSTQTATYRRSVTDYNLPTAQTQTDDVVITIPAATDSVWVGGVEKAARFDILRGA